MLRSAIIILLVFAFLGGGLLILRRSARSGMPDAKVLKRAEERARQQKAAEDAER